MELKVRTVSNQAVLVWVVRVVSCMEATFTEYSVSN